MKTQCFQRILIPTILTCFLAAFYLTEIEAVKFHPDESHWITSSKVFEEFFSARFDSPYFDNSYWTVTQPPLARYFIGMGRRIGGYRWVDLPPSWNWKLDAAVNIQRGAMPSHNLLWWARLPMAILGIISIMTGFVLIREAAGQTAGYIWVALSVNSSYLLLHLRRAMGESPLLLCVAVVAFLSYRVLLLLQTEKSIQVWKLFVWLSILGTVAGAAGAAKLNGLSATLAGMGLAIIVVIKLKRSIFQKLLFGFLTALIVVLFSLFAFVGLNPYLWPNPVARTQGMFEHRLKEMDNQQQQYSKSKIDSLSERVKVIPERIFQTHAAMDFEKSFVINIPLFVMGLYTIVKKSWQSLSRRLIEPAPIAIILVSVAVATPPLFTPLDWDRYYLLPVFFTTFFIAIGAAEIVKKLGMVQNRANHVWHP